MPRRSLVLLVLVVLVSCLVLAADTPSAFLGKLPDMPREVAWHLAHDSDSELRAYANRAGYMDLKVGIDAFIRAPDRTSPEAYARSLARI